MKNKENTLGANKQMAFFNTTKLAVALKRTLMILTLCIISTLCIQAEESTIEAPDSVTISGPKKSHWTSSGWFGSTTYKNNTDYARIEATIEVYDEGGHIINAAEVGSVDISYTKQNDGTDIESPSSLSSTTTAFVNWNSGTPYDGLLSDKDNNIKAKHTLNVTLTITDKEGDTYVFEKWEKKIGSTDTPLDPSINPKSTTINDNVVIGGGGAGFTEYGTSQNQAYEDANKRYTVTYTAKFVPKQTECNVTFDKARGGGEYTYKNGDGTATTVTTETEEQVVPLNGTTATTLTALTNEDYKLWAWYVSYDEGKTYSILSQTTPYTCTFEKDAIIYAQFIPSDAALFIIKGGDGTEYWNLNEACTKAQSSSLEVVLPKGNGTLYPLVNGELCISIPEGKTATEYTILDGVTLLVPYNTDNTSNKATVARVRETSIATAPKCYRTLTIASGVNIIVPLGGSIEVGGEQNIANQTTSTVGAPRNHGKIRMASGSSITINGGASLYCWGYIVGVKDAEGQVIGEGTITADNEAKVYECLQLRDWKGGGVSSKLINNENKFFPANQYYIQNIETPITFSYGAEDLVSTGVYMMNQQGLANNVPFITTTEKNDGLMRLKTGSKLLRDYNEESDRIEYTLTGDADFVNLNLNLSVLGQSVNIKSSDYYLPVTNNMNLHVLSGTLTLKANISISVGAKIDIDKGAKAIIDKNYSVYIFDKEDWQGYFFPIYPLLYANETTYTSANHDGNNHRTWEETQDATICVNGTLQVDGYLYSTEHGANICSTDNGVVIFNKSAPKNGTIKQLVGHQAEDGLLGTNYTLTWGEDKITTPAQLHNDTTKNPNYHYTQTSGAAAGDEFWYVKSLGKWVKNEPLDIVDADNTDNTNKTLTINANGWASSGWPYTINVTSYEKNAREADRTLVIPYSGEPNADMPIVVKNASNEIVSHHIYKVPFVYTGDATMSGTDENSIVFVKSGTLTVGDALAKEIYVAPGAELKVNGELDVEKLVLRTTPWQAAVLTNSGTINGQVYYSRIAPNKSTIKDLQNTEIEYNSARYYQFGLPLSCSISSVTMSNTGKFGESNTPYGNTWLLKSYNESKRAENGISSSGDNWEALESTGTITAGVGYEMFSNSNYYREFYFPVTLPATATTTVGVSYTGGTKAEHNGWNIVCSPLTGNTTVSFGDPATAIKPCWLLADGSYTQEIPEIIPPAIPFAYQTSTAGTLNFVVSTAAAAPRRQSATEALTETEWVHLDIFDAYGEGDETSLFVHPTRFEQTYKTGIDVAKQSLTAARPIIYSTHAYGDMAFAGVADSLLENGIDLVVYSPSAQELTFSLRENKFLHRLEYLWLADNETGERTDLLMDDYTCRANAGTTKGRFVLNGRFKAPQISTGIGNTQTDYNIYAIGNNIAISGVEQGTPIYVFDAVGHMIYTTTATSDEVIVPAPCAGVYMLTIGGQTAKLVINQ